MTRNPSQPTHGQPTDLRIFVSLTTIPPRMARIQECLASLVSQTRSPEKIFLCVPETYRRFETSGPSPLDDFAFDERVEIVNCPRDDGPGTKILGSLDRVPREENVLLVLVDDDVVYEPHMLAIFAEAHEERPSEAASFFVYRYRGLDVGQAADGFAIPANTLAGLSAYHRRIRDCPAIFYVDDLWISHYLWMNSVPIRSLGERAGPNGLIRTVYNDIDGLNRKTGQFSRKRAMLRSRWFLRRKLDLGGHYQRLLARWKFSER